MTKSRLSKIEIKFFMLFFYRYYSYHPTLIPCRSRTSRRVTRSSNMGTILPTDYKDQQTGNRRPQ